MASTSVKSHIQTSTSTQKQQLSETIELFDKIPTHILFDQILAPLKIRDILKFGQAVINNEKYKEIFLNWLFSDRTRNLVYEKMKSTAILDFLVDLQLPTFDDKVNEEYGPEHYRSFKHMRREMYEQFNIKDNIYEPFDFSLNYLSGIMLDHLFYGKQTTPASVTSSGMGIWTKMPGEDSKNANDISYIQKIMAQMLLQAPKNMGFIYIIGTAPGKDMDRVILPDFYDEPIKNDPENCHLYDYMTEMKLDTIEGQRRAAILSSLVSHLICSYEGYGLRIRYFEFWNKKRIPVKIYTPANESEKNFLEKINFLVK